MNNLDHITSDYITDGDETLSSIKSGVKSITSMNIEDLVQLVIIVAVIVVCILIVLKISGTVAKWAVAIILILAFSFVVYGLDPMGYGTIVSDYIYSIFVNNIQPLFGG